MKIVKSIKISSTWLVVALLTATLSAIPHPAAALCGDPGGDGRVTATDALTALAIATGAEDYDPRADTDLGPDFDGNVSATDALRLLSSAIAGAIPDCAAAIHDAIVVGTASCDFVTGGIGEIALDSLEVTEHHAGRVSADSVIRHELGRVFAVNRFGADSIQELDGDNGYSTVFQCTTGPGSNPHDLKLLDAEKAYVSRYDATSVLVVDPSAGPTCAGFERTTIDLTSLADTDGIPEMDQMALVGDTLFVALQRLDRGNFFEPSGNAALAVIDTSTDTLTGSIELSIANPFVETKGIYVDQDSGLLYVAGPGKLFTNLEDGGIEAVDPVAGASLGVVMSGAELGGDIVDLAIAGSRRAFALVTDASFFARLVEIDLQAGTVSEPFLESDLQISDIELTQSGLLIVSDRKCPDQTGVRVFEIGSLSSASEITSIPIFPGLAPFTLLPR